ncbi:hypothetical protein HS99_0017015 [Kitasatospora aureofaciens]|uniref:Uncharacterized protein n=1 Tax=Kitasatospora aureofaciens TaxID=1894 RepID=A0A1E7MVE6_KITAU|nr:hypothetical protein HS99_0017015 [Kitasatospora aureofaciens]
MPFRPLPEALRGAGVAQHGLEQAVHGDGVAEGDQVVVGEQPQCPVHLVRAALPEGGEGFARQRLGGVPGQGAQQVDGEGRGVLDGPQRGPPEAGDGVLGPRSHRPGVPQQFAVRREGGAGLLYVGAGLGEGDRQVAQLVGEGAGLVLLGRIEGRARVRRPAEQPGGLGGVEDVDPYGPDARVPAARAAAGDQLVAAAEQPADVGGEVSRVLGVVVDEQPAVVGAQPGDGPLDLLAGRGGEGPGGVEVDGESGEGLGELSLGLGGDPPDQPVVVGPRVGVVQGEAGLADAAEAVEGGGLGDQPAAAVVRQGVGDGPQLALPADESAGGAGRQVGRRGGRLDGQRGPRGLGREDGGVRVRVGGRGRAGAAALLEGLRVGHAALGTDVRRHGHQHFAPPTPCLRLRPPTVVLVRRVVSGLPQGRDPSGPVGISRPAPAGPGRWRAARGRCCARC